MRSVAASPNGKLIVTSTGDWDLGGDLSVWDVDKRAKVLNIPSTQGYRSITFTPDGATIFAGHYDGRLTSSAPRRSPGTT